MAIPVTEQILANPRILAYSHTHILAEQIVQYEYDFVDGKAEMYQQPAYMGEYSLDRLAKAGLALLVWEYLRWWDFMWNAA